MSLEALTSPELAEGNPAGTGNVSQALKRFQGIEKRVWRWVLWIVPAVIAAFALLVEIILWRARDPMHFSGVIAAALSLLAFQVLMRRIPETFNTIWQRELVAPESTTDRGDTSSADESRKVSNNEASDAAALEERYLTFVQDLQGSLNHRLQWAMGALFAVLGFARFPYKLFMYYFVKLQWGTRLGWGPSLRRIWSYLTWAYWLQSAVEAFLGVVLGLVAWRMVITGVQIWRFGKRFDLIPQLRHPDKCGGLAPLGNLCLWNALIISIPAVYLGGWIILAPRLEIYGTLYLSLHSTMLLVLMALAIVAFFLPLWTVHQEMVAQRAVVRRQLDQLTQSINSLAHEMLDRADELEPEEGNKMAEKLALMRQIYQEYERYPVWPFNVDILTKFATSQAVPILGLTGMGGKMLDLVGSFLGFLGQTGPK